MYDHLGVSGVVQKRCIANWLHCQSDHFELGEHHVFLVLFWFLCPSWSSHVITIPVTQESNPIMLIAHIIGEPVRQCKFFHSYGMISLIFLVNSMASRKRKCKFPAQKVSTTTVSHQAMLVFKPCASTTQKEAQSVFMLSQNKWHFVENLDLHWAGKLQTDDTACIEKMQW